jgi:hypothetical protein
MEKSRTGQRENAGMRAHSAREAAWQSWRAGALGGALAAACAVLGLIGAVAQASERRADPEGPLRTLRRGAYVCELPGTALTETGLHQSAEDFIIRKGSIYETASGRGAYLATGDEVLMTTGPKQGQRYHRLSDNFLRLLAADGTDAPLRCVRKVLNNQ